MIKFGILDIENFFRIQKLTINLSGSGITLIEGDNKDVGASNETGKTSLFQAVCWCAFGRYPGGGAKAGDEVINPLFGDNCKVSLEVLKDEKNIITRTRLYGASKSSGVYLTKGELTDEDMRKRAIDDDSETIKKLIGMDYDTFVRANYFPQEGVDPFGTMNDRFLKEFFLQKILDITWLDKCYDLVHKDYGIRSKEITAKESEISSIRGLLREFYSTRDSMVEKIREWNKQKEENLASIIERIRLAELEKVEAQLALAAKKDELSEINKRIEAINLDTTTDSEYKKLQGELVRKQYDLKSVLSNISGWKDKADKLSKSLEDKKSLIGTKCDKCGNEIKEENITHIQAGILTDIGNLDSKISQNENVIVELENSIINIKEQMEKMLSTIEEGNRLKEEKQELESKFVNTPELKRFNDAENNLKNIKDGYEKEYGSICPFNSLLENAESKIDNQIILLEKEELNLKLLEDNYKKLSFWHKAFSPGGIQSFLLESVVDSVNNNVKKYLKYLADGRISAVFTVTKKLKSGETREKFGLEVKNIDGGNTYASLSGGAKKRVDIACALAIGDFKRTISENELDFIVFDEVTAGMVDKYWIGQFMKMVRNEFSDKSVWFITHQEVEPYYFDNKITLVKKDGITRLANQW